LVVIQLVTQEADAPLRAGVALKDELVRLAARRQQRQQPLLNVVRARRLSELKANAYVERRLFERRQFEKNAFVSVVYAMIVMTIVMTIDVEAMVEEAMAEAAQPLVDA
jgi:hypothetical protein